MRRKKKYYIVENRNRSVKKNNKIVTYSIILAIIIILIIGIIFIKLGIDKRKEKIPIYTLLAEKSSNYEILLKPNEFYTAKTLPSGSTYASQSINSIKINFKYNFNENEKVKINYKYNIIAELVGTVKVNENQNKEVWSRTFNLLDNKENLSENSINEEINLDYEFYNNLSRSYENTYRIGIDSTLKVKFYINYNINLSNLNLNNESWEDYIELDVPITNTVTELKENYENKTTKEIFDSNNKINTKEICFYIIGVVLIISAIIVGIMFIKKNRNNRTLEEIYENNINHILRYYKDIIVTVNDEPDLTDLAVMNVAIFEDLIDVAEQNKRNIIHYEVRNELKSKLYVIVDKYVYLYTVTSEEI